MRKIKMRRLDRDAFRKYGHYADMISPGTERIGDPPSEFFRDVLSLKLGATTVASISTCRVTSRPLVIDVLEYHNRCGEAMIPLDGDIIVQVAPATPGREIPYDKVEAYLVPRGTIVVFDYGVWHHAPFAVGPGTVSIMSLLPERTYENDAVVIPLTGDGRIEIEE